MVKKINCGFKYAIELNTPIDFFDGGYDVYDLNHKLIEDYEKANGTIDGIVHSDEYRSSLGKIGASIYFVEKNYGKVRDNYSFYIPAFMQNTCDSSIINIVKADNNGTTIVFCDNKEIVPSNLIEKIICFEEESKC